MILWLPLENVIVILDLLQIFQIFDGRTWSWTRTQPREHLHRLGQHQVGRAHARGEMELRASEDASKGWLKSIRNIAKIIAQNPACWTCGDARRDDPHPHCRSDCQSSMSCSVEEMEALQLSRLYFNRLVLI